MQGSRLAKLGYIHFALGVSWTILWLFLSFTQDRVTAVFAMMTAFMSTHMAATLCLFTIDRHYRQSSRDATHEQGQREQSES